MRSGAIPGFAAPIGRRIIAVMSEPNPKAAKTMDKPMILGRPIAHGRAAGHGSGKALYVDDVAAPGRVLIARQAVVGQEARP